MDNDEMYVYLSDKKLDPFPNSTKTGDKVIAKNKTPDLLLE